MNKRSIKYKTTPKTTNDAFNNKHRLPLDMVTPDIVKAQVTAKLDKRAKERDELYKGNLPKAIISPYHKTNLRPVGTHSKGVGDLLTLYHLQPIKTDEELLERIVYYFSWCIERDRRPSVAGMALAIGINVRDLRKWELNTDGNRANRARLINRAKIVINELLEEILTDGKANPVGAIFLLKNHFDYTNEERRVLITDSPLTNEISSDEIKASILKSLAKDVVDEEE